MLKFLFPLLLFLPNVSCNSHSIDATLDMHDMCVYDLQNNEDLTQDESVWQNQAFPQFGYYFLQCQWDACGGPLPDRIDGLR